MRRIGKVAAIIAVVLLIRCGEADQPRAEPLQPMLALEKVEAPTPAVAVPDVKSPRHPNPKQLERVRGLVCIIGVLGCGSNIFLNNSREPDQMKELWALGESVFVYYEIILTDPKSHWEEIKGTCDVISQLPNRRRFIPLMIQRLTRPDAMVLGDASFDISRFFIRRFIISTLEVIGDERDAWALVCILHMDDRDLQCDAAEALAKIGAQPELEALNLWLATQNPADRRITRIREFRDQFQRRLLINPTPPSF